MSIPIHRETDSRICGATTIAVGNQNVYANFLLVSVNADPNSHNGGSLIAGSKNVFCNNKLVVNHSPDSANPDALCIPRNPHCSPDTASGSPNVFVGD